MDHSPPTISNVLYIPDFLADSSVLFERLRADISWDERINARKTATFGTPYNYSGLTYPAVPMHPLLIPIVDRLDGILFRPNNCLLNYYTDGNSTMGFHADSIEELTPGTGVAIVSLGAERTLTFRLITDRSVRVHYRLTSGSLLFMPDTVQTTWQHAVQREPAAGGRISLTFRQLLLV